MITKEQIAKIEGMIKNFGICLKESDTVEWVPEILSQMERDEKGRLSDDWKSEAEDIIARIACGGCH